ncbi:hypothetical protein FZEAL_9928 [Fusarium zealandicum]|uniref:Uncharacterized protein n=1 Tax=Fusarium zealandicum TaxID=1053134 RepID=A0A8H4U7K6_9HYPO|nr:hypothetical protein FZEAL_9928 [Fusarium zealandicum]
MDRKPTKSEAKKLPSLPTEIILKILNMSLDVNVCWIHKLTKGLSSPCEGLGEESTVIYTRGHPDREGEYSRGSIEVLPLQHRCLFNAPIKDINDFLTVPGDKTWEDSLREYDLSNRMQVFDRQWNKFLSVTFLHAASDEDAPESTTVLDPDILDSIPFSDNSVYGKTARFVPRAWTNVLKKGDQKLACQFIRHLMIHATNAEEDDADIARKIIKDLFGSTLSPGNRHTVLTVALEKRMDELGCMIELSWPLMSNLQSLCLDLRCIRAHTYYDWVKDFYQDMGQHLRLKTLVLVGLPCRMNFGDLGEEAWVAMLEDNELIEGEDEEMPEEKEMFPTYIHIFKECLLPGGQLHLICDIWPWAWQWSAPRQSIFQIDDDDEIVELVGVPATLP